VGCIGVAKKDIANGPVFFPIFCKVLNYKALFDIKKLERECALTIQKK
jgi:hypothetical protein